MKAEYKKGWSRSTQKRKQRKFRANAPKHVAGRFLNANLSKDLRAKHSRRSLRVRTGDEVEVLRGSFKGKKGQVDSVDTGKQKLLVRGVELVKRDGSRTPLAVAVSNVRITKLTEDKRRI